MLEIWLPISKSYEVSNLGRVKSKTKILKDSPNSSGYRKVCLGRSRQEYVHRLVLEAFQGPCPPEHEVDHIDFNPNNNKLDNLRYLHKDLNRMRQRRYGVPSS